VPQTPQTQYGLSNRGKKARAEKESPHEKESPCKKQPPAVIPSEARDLSWVQLQHKEGFLVAELQAMATFWPFSATSSAAKLCVCRFLPALDRPGPTFVLLRPGAYVVSRVVIWTYAKILAKLPREIADEARSNSN
jgi:hypothetical protein